MLVTDAGFYQCKARSQDGYSLLSRVSQVLIKHTSFDDTVVSSDGVVTNKGQFQSINCCLIPLFESRTRYINNSLKLGEKSIQTITYDRKS